MIKEPMACHSFPAVVLVVVLVACLLAPPAVTASSVNISTYWGTNSAEGSIEDACKTGLYSIVNIGFVYKFGNGCWVALGYFLHVEESPKLNY